MKKTASQYDKEIAAVGDAFSIDRGNYRVVVAIDPYRGGYSAKLISVGIGTVLEPNGATPRQAVAELIKDLSLGFSEKDRRLASEIRQIVVSRYRVGRKVR